MTGWTPLDPGLLGWFAPQWLPWGDLALAWTSPAAVAAAARAFTLTLSLPLIGDRLLPLSARLLVAGALAGAAALSAPAGVVLAEPGLTQLAEAAWAGVAGGLCLGLALRAAWGAVLTAAHLAGVGLALSPSWPVTPGLGQDPHADDSPGSVEPLARAAALAALLASGADLALVKLVLACPPPVTLEGTLPAALAAQLAVAMTHALAVGLWLATPAVAAVLLAEATCSLALRLSPATALSSAALPVRAALGLGVVALFLAWLWRWAAGPWLGAVSMPI